MPYFLCVKFMQFVFLVVRPKNHILPTLQNTSLLSFSHHPLLNSYLIDAITFINRCYYILHKILNLGYSVIQYYSRSTTIIYVIRTKLNRIRKRTFSSLCSKICRVSSMNIHYSRNFKCQFQCEFEKKSFQQSTKIYGCKFADY